MDWNCQRFHEGHNGWWSRPHSKQYSKCFQLWFGEALRELHDQRHSSRSYPYVCFAVILKCQALIRVKDAHVHLARRWEESSSFAENATEKGSNVQTGPQKSWNGLTDSNTIPNPSRLHPHPKSLSHAHTVLMRQMKSISVRSQSWNHFIIIDTDSWLIVYFRLRWPLSRYVPGLRLSGRGR